MAVAAVVKKATLDELLGATAESPITWKNLDTKMKDAGLTICAPVRFHAVVEPYLGAPSSEVEPYERVRYRYAIESVQKAHAFAPSLNLRIQTKPYPRRRAAFGRDEEFKSLDLVEEILHSDVNVAWRENVARCAATGTWLLHEEPLSEAQKAKAVSFDWIQKQLQKFEKDAERASLMEKAEKERAFIEQHMTRLNIDFEVLLQYVVDNGQVARNYLSKVKPAEIDRFTIELKPEGNKVIWPKWYDAAPESFKELAKACNATPETLLVGTFDQNLFKAYRTTWNEVATNPQLPNSPKIRGLLEALGASKESLEGFEKRTEAKGFATTQKVGAIAAQKNRFYLSNDLLPLFMIGNWGVEKNGQRTYASCQTWYRNGWGGGGGNFCRTPASWEDPNIMVAWAGEEQLMRTRVLVHLMVDPKTKEKLAGLNNWYGTQNNSAELIRLLQVWCKDNGYKLVKLCGGGYYGNNANITGQCEWPKPVKFSAGAWYSDLGGFTHHGNAAGGVGGHQVQVETQLRLSYNDKVDQGQRFY